MRGSAAGTCTVPTLVLQPRSYSVNEGGSATLRKRPPRHKCQRRQPLQSSKTLYCGLRCREVAASLLSDPLWWQGGFRGFSGVPPPTLQEAEALEHYTEVSACHSASPNLCSVQVDGQEEGPPVQYECEFPLVRLHLTSLLCSDLDHTADVQLHACESHRQSRWVVRVRCRGRYTAGCTRVGGDFYVQLHHGPQVCRRNAHARCDDFW